MKKLVLTVSFIAIATSTILYNKSHFLESKSPKSVRSSAVRISQTDPPSKSLSIYKLSKSENSKNENLESQEALNLKEELEQDLAEIKHRKMVETINDPKANRAEKEIATEFMSNYLRKTAAYLKFRTKIIQELAGELHE